MAKTGACRWFLLITMPRALFSEIGIWNINTSKFMILSNFAHLTTWSSFQPIICILLDLFLIYFKANIQVSEHPLGILMFWYSKQRLKIAVVNWRVLSTSRQHYQGCCWSDSLLHTYCLSTVAVLFGDWTLHDLMSRGCPTEYKVVLGKTLVIFP